MDNIKRLKTERIDTYKPILPMSHNIDGHEDRMKALIKRELEYRTINPEPIDPPRPKGGIKEGA